METKSGEVRSLAWDHEAKREVPGLDFHQSCPSVPTLGDWEPLRREQCLFFLSSGRDWIPVSCRPDKHYTSELQCRVLSGPGKSRVWSRAGRMWRIWIGGNKQWTWCCDVSPEDLRCSCSCCYCMLWKRTVTDQAVLKRVKGTDRSEPETTDNHFLVGSYMTFIVVASSGSCAWLVLHECFSWEIPQTGPWMLLSRTLLCWTGGELDHEGRVSALLGADLVLSLLPLVYKHDNTVCKAKIHCKILALWCVAFRITVFPCNYYLLWEEKKSMEL